MKMKIQNEKTSWAALLILIFSGVLCASTPAAAQVINQENSELSWFKADLHTHYTFHDPLEKEVEKYRETGYKFLVLSTKDSQQFIKYSKYSSPEMLVIEGVEQAFLTRKNQLGHVLAFPFKAPYPFTTSWTLKEGYEKLRAKNKNVIMGINHPHDGRWSLDDVMEADGQGIHIFELNSQGMKHGEFETALWDQALSAGARLYGTLTNDVHSFDDVDRYGAIMIRAKSLELGAVLDAIRAGDFYAKETGCDVKPERYEITGSGSERKLIIEAPGAANIKIYARGTILASSDSGSASYGIKGDEIYLRAELIGSNGRYIFLQPFFLK